jgi:5-methylthioadenosine/S-adenosylhomocysteine deaminase
VSGPTTDTDAARSWLVVGRDVITMNARREIVRDGAVAVVGGEIVAVDKAAELRRRYPGARELGDPDAVVTPGFVNAHHHLTGDRLVRSAIPDELAPGESIFTWAVPVHAHHSPDDDELSATLAAAEQVEQGFTTIVEAGAVAHPDRVAAGLRRVGVRATVGTWGWDVDDAPYAAPAAEVLARQTDVVERYADDPLVTGWVTLVGHDLMSDELLTGASELARARGVGITFHISPHGGDAAAYLQRTGVRPLVHFERLGALGPHVLLAHAVHLDDDEADVVLRTRAAIAYTPWAYLRLGQGVSAAGRHAALSLAGGRIALGCDSENAGDAVDPLRVIALAAGIAKDQVSDPTRFGAHAAFEWATIAGAEAIGMADRIGSLEVGKRADVVVHDTSSLVWAPRSADPVLQLVWAGSGTAVREVLVDGRLVVRDGRGTAVDHAALRVEAATAAPALLERAGIRPPSRWPIV